MNSRFRYPVRPSGRPIYPKHPRQILVDLSQLPAGLPIEQALELFMEASLNISISDKPLFTVINGYGPRELELARMHCDEQPEHIHLTNPSA